MRFEFEGRTYEIRFQHSRSLRWEDHWKHEVALVRNTKTKYGKPQGPAVLMCVTCTGKATARQGKAEADCTVRLSHTDRGRVTTADILVATSSAELIPVGRGMAQCHSGPGPQTMVEVLVNWWRTAFGLKTAQVHGDYDIFNKKIGRQLALKRAIRSVTSSRYLEPASRGTFHNAAMKAYATRFDKEKSAHPKEAAAKNYGSRMTERERP